MKKTKDNKIKTTKKPAKINKTRNDTKAKKGTAKVKIHCLGAGREVGCNAFLIEGKERNIMLDYGLDVSNNKPPIMPKIKVDDLFLCHGHLDHVGSAAELYKISGCNVYGTSATKDQTKLLLKDSLKLARIKGIKKNFSAYDVATLDNNWKKITYGQEIKLGKSTKVKIFNAGHIPGSSCVLVETNGKKILYTSDFKTESTRLVDGANIDIKNLDLLIMETTYSSKDHPKRSEIEKKFFDLVKATIDQGGIALIPSFSIRAPELLVVLNKFKPNFPIYLDGMAKAATEISLENKDSITDPVALKKAVNNSIFVNSTDLRKAAVKRPGAIITTGGCLDGGPVVTYLRYLYSRDDCSLILTGFQIPGTAGKYLEDTGRYVNDALDLKLKMPIYHFDFSSHAGRTELLKFAQKLRPKKVICIHGSHCQRFATELKSRFAIETIAPRNGEIIEVN